MKHTERCRGSFRIVLGLTCPDGTKLFRETSECATCGAWLSLGPSNESKEPVRVEIRAAEIWERVFNVMDADHAAAQTCDPSELNGWLAHRNGRFPSMEDEHAGYLAHVIYDHDADPPAHDEAREPLIMAPTPTPEQRAQVVGLLRAAVVEAESGDIVPIRAAALSLGLWNTDVSKMAQAAARAVVEARIPEGVKPDRFEYPAMLRRAALNVEEGSWPTKARMPPGYPA